MIPNLAICTTHPIQVQAPIFRALAERDDLRIHVFFASDDNVRPTFSADFGVTMQWDTPLLEGYPYTFLPNRARVGREHPRPSTLRRFFLYDCPDVSTLLAEGRFDALLIPGYSRYYYLQAARGAWRAGIPVLIRGNNNDGTGIQRPLWKRTIRWTYLKWMYRRIDAFLSIGQYMRRHFLEFGVSGDRIFDTPYCIDDKLFQTQREKYLPQRQEIRRELGIPESALTILYAGKLIPKKAPLVLAAALRKLGRNPNLRVLVMGDGPLRTAVEKEVEPVLGEDFRILGFVNQTQVGRFYAAADVLVLPSDWGETWGLVVNEAMTFGRPAIVSDSVGCREDLVHEGETGFIFPRNDPDGLADRIQRFLDNPELATEMGAKARQVAARYSVSENVAGIMQALRALDIS